MELQDHLAPSGYLKFPNVSKHLDRPDNMAVKLIFFTRCVLYSHEMKQERKFISILMISKFYFESTSSLFDNLCIFIGFVHPHQKLECDISACSYLVVLQLFGIF